MFCYLWRISLASVVLNSKRKDGFVDQAWITSSSFTAIRGHPMLPRKGQACSYGHSHTHNVENQVMNTNMLRDVHHPDNALQNCDGSCLPLGNQNLLPTQLHSSHNPMAGISSTPLQQRDVVRQPVLNNSHQDREFGQHNVSCERDLQHPLVYQQSMSVQEPSWTSNSMLNMNRGQQSIDYRGLSRTSSKQCSCTTDAPSGIINATFTSAGELTRTEKSISR